MRHLFLQTSAGYIAINKCCFYFKFWGEYLNKLVAIVNTIIASASWILKIHMSRKVLYQMNHIS